MFTMYRYSSGDSRFLMIDGRNSDVSRFRKKDFLHSLCLIHGFSGAVILDKALSADSSADFRMEFYSSDGIEVAPAPCACACTVAFADFLGVKPFHTRDYSFETSLGLSPAFILSQNGDCKAVSLSVDSAGVSSSPGIITWFEGEFS